MFELFIEFDVLSAFLIEVVLQFDEFDFVLCVLFFEGFEDFLEVKEILIPERYFFLEILFMILILGSSFI